MIQGSINQLLNMAAIGARLDPNVESRAEARRAEKQLAALGEQEEEIEATLTPLSREGEADYDIYKEIQKEKSETAKKLFQAKPTRETASTYRRAKVSAGESSDIVIQADPEEIELERWEAEQTQKELAYQKAQEEAQAALRLRQQEIHNTLLSNAPITMGRRETHGKY